eukprot:7981509-Pyramimonas_sp.AAC.1
MLHSSCIEKNACAGRVAAAHAACDRANAGATLPPHMGPPRSAAMARKDAPACLGDSKDNITLRARLSSASLAPTI